MQFDLGDKTMRLAFIRATETGAQSNCPFCKGRMITSVSKGDRIIVLQGMNAGKQGTVTATRGVDDREFIAHFDFEPEHYETRIGYSWDRFAFTPIEQIPEWLCQLSIDDLNAIDDSVIKTAALLAASGTEIWSVETLIPILGTVRSRRLPLSGADLWPTLEVTASRRIFGILSRITSILQLRS
jgi:hypothetical protein